MGSNQQIVQLLERIQSVLEEFKSETKQQFSRNIEQENWKAVAVLNDCASWIDAGIAACGQMSARCVSLEEADPATADHEKSVSKSLWFDKEESKRLRYEFNQYESIKYPHYKYRYQKLTLVKTSFCRSSCINSCTSPTSTFHFMILRSFISASSLCFM